MKELLILIVFSSLFTQITNAQNPIENKVDVVIEDIDGEKQLIWRNNKQVNVSYYLIEYSTYQNPFNILTSVKVVVSSKFDQSYHFPISNLPYDSIYRYRIVTVLMGGQRLYSHILDNSSYPDEIEQRIIATK